MSADGAASIVGDDERAAFARDGFLVLRGFFDPERDVDAVRRGIHEVIGLVADEGGVPLSRAPYAADRFDDGYLALKAADRSLASTVYDAVKQLPAFVRLVADPRAEAVMRSLRPDSMPGIAAGGSGIRIDNPDEDQYRAWWHQEYPAQFRSLDGIVIWSPLRALTPELGPVELLRGSHVEGLLPVVSDTTSGRDRAYALRLRDEDAVVTRHERVAPLTRPGDAVVIDFLTVHRSGRNTSAEPRWTMQSRWFNFAEPTGRSIGWAGSFAAGNRIADVHPGLEVAP